jgi:RimJ/RimL family protein N-acetyltransferase
VGLPTLETARLVLRPLEASDLDDYARMMADPDVARFLGGEVADRVESWRILALLVGHGVLRGFTNHAVVERSTGRFLGRAGLWQPEGWPGLEVGWALDRAAWGHGYASEAGIAWRDHAFAAMGADELVSVIALGNERSEAVARRIGHTRGRELEVRGTRCALWGQTRADWERTQE